MLTEQLRLGRPEAAAAIWTWKPSEGVASQHKRRTGPVRLRGAIQATVGFAVAGLFAWRGHQVPAMLVGSIATFVLLSALLSPLGLFAAIERSIAAVGRGIGRAFTWVLLPTIFYLFFVPFGALFRRGRRDSMTRYFVEDAPSYWSSRSARNGKTASSSSQRPY